MKIVIIAVLCILLVGCGNVKPEYREIAQEEAHQNLQEKKDIILLDVRTYIEYSQGYIPGAINLSSVDIKEKAEEVLKDKDAIIYVYCRTGSRSEVATKQLNELGYTHVYDMGGIESWKYETVK